jgi:hypothetical protein
MANLGATFDATTVDPTSSYDLFPPGRYVVQIVQSEMRPNRSGNGQGLSLEMEILDGPVTGRRMFDRLNLVHPNPQTVEIAQRTLSAICHATGRMQVQDSEELHLIPMVADVTVAPPKNGYGEQNRIKYRPLNEPVAQQQTPRAPAQPAAQTAAPAPRPQAAPPAQPAKPATAGFASAPWKRQA